MIFEISFRVLSDSWIFLNDSAKFWEDSEKFWEDSEKSWEDSADDSDNFVKFSADDDSMFFNWAVDCFSLFFRKKNWLDCTFDDKFFANLNDILISSLNDFLFLDDVFEVINLMNWDVLDVSATAFIDDDLICS